MRWEDMTGQFFSDEKVAQIQFLPTLSGNRLEFNNRLSGQFLDQPDRDSPIFSIYENWLREAAYYSFLRRQSKGKHGNSFDDWHRASIEISQMMVGCVRLKYTTSSTHLLHMWIHPQLVDDLEFASVYVEMFRRKHTGLIHVCTSFIPKSICDALQVKHKTGIVAISLADTTAA